MYIPEIVITVPSMTAAIACIFPFPYWYLESGSSSDFLMAKKLKMETAISSSESMAEARTATEPLATPMISLTKTNTVATELETIVAFFCGDICTFKKDPVGLILLISFHLSRGGTRSRGIISLL